MPSTLRYYKLILKCTWMHLQLSRCIKDAMIFDNWNCIILDLLRPLQSMQETLGTAEISAQGLRNPINLVRYSHMSCSLGPMTTRYIVYHILLCLTLVFHSQTNIRYNELCQVLAIQVVQYMCWWSIWLLTLLQWNWRNIWSCRLSKLSDAIRGLDAVNIEAMIEWIWKNTWRLRVSEVRDPL